MAVTFGHFQAALPAGREDRVVLSAEACGSPSTHRFYPALSCIYLISRHQIPDGLNRTLPLVPKWSLKKMRMDSQWQEGPCHTDAPPCIRHCFMTLEGVNILTFLPSMHSLI